MKEMKRIISLVLCLVMVVGLVPMSVFAADVTEPIGETTPVTETEAPSGGDDASPETTGSDATDPDNGIMPIDDETETVSEFWGEWVTVMVTTGTVATYTYTQDTNGVDSGSAYLIVNNSLADAIDDDGNGGITTAAITIHDDGTVLTSTQDHEWKFDSNNRIYTTINGENYYLYAYNSNNNAALTLTTNNGDATQWQVSRNNNVYTISTRIQVGSRRQTYYLTTTGLTANSNTYVRLYKLTASSSNETADTVYVNFAGAKEYTVNYGTSAADALAAVHAGVTGYYTLNENGDDPKELDDTAMTWTLDSSYSGTTPGNYTVTISYKETELGTATVIVDDPGEPEFSLSPTSYASVKTGDTVTSATLTVWDENREYVLETVPVTLDMLTDNGEKVSSAKAGTYSDLTVSYTFNGTPYTVATGFTLHVLEQTIENYPDYPDEGAVEINKTAVGVDFQASGVADVELSVHGVPDKTGVDVIVMVDTSSSMKRGTSTGNDEAATGYQRIDYAQAAVANLIKQFQAVGDDGEQLDIRMAIAEFNGYTHISNNQTLSGTSVQTSSNVAQIFTGSKTINAGAFVHATDITDPDTFVEDIAAHSGTNYDYAFDTIYRLGAAIQKENADNNEERDLFVIFMSDGAPYQYNYYGSQTVDEWNDYLLGTLDDDNNLNLLGGSYTCFYNADGDHWMAEAIKGATDRTYQVIDPQKSLGSDADVAGDGDYFRLVSGLGATMYTIGFCLYDDDVGEDKIDVVYELTQHTVLENLASVDSYGNALYYETHSGEDLATIFGEIASLIEYAATNAYFVDQMGDAFDLLMTTHTYQPTGTTDPDDAETIAPIIEVKAYDIVTRQDYLDSLNTDHPLSEDQIGDRLGTYTVLETVTFSEDGKKAYSSLIDADGDGTYGVTINPDGSYSIDEGDNILAAEDHDNHITGVIYAKHFAYNATSEPVTINGSTVQAESFYWYIGTITTKEMAIAYYVYLTGSMEGHAAAGSYATNNFATLHYTNYLGNECYQDAVSPVLPWGSALVRYAFYLVDENGIPVNMDGEHVTFANRVEITQPVVYDYIYLNNITEVRTIEVLSQSGLPDEYTLYDTSATYEVTIYSNATGSWTIADNTGTTYVTDFDNEILYSNETYADETSYDYTHTTVWFAVVWAPQCIPDVVVIDYGLPVDISVLNNDMFGDYGHLRYVTTGTGSQYNADSTTADDDGEPDFTTESDKGQYGIVNVIHEADGSELGKAASKVRYTPTSMVMDGIDTFTYSVLYTGGETDNGYYYGSITVIPATTIYYEDSFLTLASYTNTESEGFKADETTAWETAGEASSSVITQDEDRPGFYGLSYYDTNNIYGYDSAYTECSLYSLNSAQKITVNANSYATATFSFYGTGFDIIGLTSNKTGVLMLTVKKAETEDVVGTAAVNTYYGYTYTEADGWQVTSSDDENALYQIPVMQIEGLDYGKYTVELRASYFSALDKTTDEGYDLYIDAVRIYDPAGTGSADVKEDTTIADIYAMDNEGWPIYEELRSNVIAAADFVEGTIDGVVFIDGIRQTASVSDYISYGPNNELYLGAGQAIVFNLNLSNYVDIDTVASVHLGMKSADGSSVKYAILNSAYLEDQDDLTGAETKTLSTSTDMYYDITSLKEATIVIYNAGTSGVLSLTDIKITFTKEPEEIDTLFIVDYDVIQKILNNLQTVTPEVGEGEFDPEIKVSLPENVRTGETYTVTVTTNESVTGIKVNEENATKSGTTDGVVTWTADITAGNAAGTETVTVVASGSEDQICTVTAQITVYEYNPSINVTVSSDTVAVGSVVTVTVTTDRDVAAVAIDGTVVASSRVNKKVNYKWTAQVACDEVGTKTIEVIAYNSDGQASAPASVSVTVTADGEGTSNTSATTIQAYISQIVTNLKKWFSWT